MVDADQPKLSFADILKRKMIGEAQTINPDSAMKKGN